MHPPVSFRHLWRLTDDTGILEHAVGPVPRRKEGYSTDDQARALWACLWWLEELGQPGDQGQASAHGKAGEEQPMQPLQLAQSPQSPQSPRSPQFPQSPQSMQPPQSSPLLQPLIDTYLSFLLWAQLENGHFHNNFAYDRSREREQPSDDCLGRCLWAAALAWSHERDRDEGRRMAAEQLIRPALGRLRDIRYPRGAAYALAALGHLIRSGFPERSERMELSAQNDQTDGSAPPGRPGDPERLHDLANAMGGMLIRSYREHSTSEWRWFEPEMTYSNGILPWGLLSGYEALRDTRQRLGQPQADQRRDAQLQADQQRLAQPQRDQPQVNQPQFAQPQLDHQVTDPHRNGRGAVSVPKDSAPLCRELLEAGLESLDFLIRIMTDEQGRIRPVGNRGWCNPRFRAKWDQQPIEVMKLALASFKAYELTGKESYADVVRRCRGWFYGENDCGVPMCDPSEGSGYDGLGENGRNVNRGAESTISYLLTEVLYRKLMRENGKR